MAKTDSINRALELRDSLKIDDEIMVVDFSNTLQGKDTSKIIDLMPNIATHEYIFRAKVNVKAIDPVAAYEYKTPFIDIHTMTDSQIEDFVKNQEFDFPLWFKHNDGYSANNILDYNAPFTMQVGGCNFHDGSEKGGCWYCFVDDKSNDGKPSGKAFLKINDHIDSMLSAREKIAHEYKQHGYDLNIKVLRVSGGEPSLVLDYVLNLWREIDRRKLDFVGQIDSNLSTGYLVDKFEHDGIYEKNILEKLAQYPIKILTAIKGTDNANIEKNVQSTATLETQKYSIKKFLKAGFDIYPQMYNPNPSTLEKYLTNMDKEIENFSLRVHLGPLSIYSPTTKRLTLEAQCIGESAETYIEKKRHEWKNNYLLSSQILDNYLQKHYGLSYKQSIRSDVPLRLMNKKL